MFFCAKYFITVNINKFKVCTFCKCLHQKRYISLWNSLKLKEKEYCDPIFEKYDRMISNISKNKQDRDVEYATNFGSIRFDNDDAYSKKYENYSQANGESGDKDCTSTLEDSTTLNYIDDVYFKDCLPLESNDYVHMQYVNTKHEEFQPPHDLNVIDSQYIVTESNPYPNVNFDNERVHDTDNISRLTKDCTEINDASEYKQSQLVKDTHHITYSFEDSIKNENSVLEETPLLQTKSNSYCHKYNEEETADRMQELLKEVNEIFPERNKFTFRNNVKQSELKYHTKMLDVSEKPQNEACEKLSKSEIESRGLNISPTLEEVNSNNLVSPIIDTEEKYSISAFDFVKKKRKEESLANLKEIKGEYNEYEKYKRVVADVPRFSHLTQDDMVHFLKRSVLYNKNDVVAIFKPYGIPVHGGVAFKGGRFVLSDLLPSLAELLKADTLQLVHRLDLQTTGVILLAKSEVMTERLKTMFKKQLIKKTYLAITKNIPKSMNGIIDIPIGEGKVDNIQRMVLRPDVDGFRGRPGQSKRALTKYKVLSCSNSAALLEISPITGIKHQIRVHLGFGIDCPILGDHKYSHLLRMAPQKLPGDLLDAFGMKQSAVRHLPLHLHSFIVNIPGVGDNGNEICIRVGPPKFFKTSLRALKLSSRKNRLEDKYSDIIFGY